MDSFGSYLRNIREDAKLTQIEAASEIGVSRNAIQDWERDAYVPEENKISKISKAYHVPERDIYHKLKICKQKEKKKVYNWPDFLFEENTNEIVKRLHLNLEQQELFGQLYMTGAITLEKKYSNYEEIDLKKLLPENIDKLGGSIHVLELTEGLKFVLRYVQESFLKKQLIKNQNEEFDLCSLEKQAICDYIDEGYKTFWDELEAEDFHKDYLDISINIKKMIPLLLEMEKKDIHWTDDNVNNSGFEGSKEIWKYNNHPREDVPQEFKQYNSIRNFPLRKDLYAWYEKDSKDGKYKKCYIRITDMGKKLLQWWRGK